MAPKVPQGGPKLLHLATVGSDPEPLLAQAGDYPIAKLVLLTTTDDRRVFATVKRRLEPFAIPVEVCLLDEANLLMDVMTQVARIVREQGPDYDGMVVNVSCGDKMLTCSALSAAFHSGIKPVGVDDGVPFELPMLKYHFMEKISGPKRRILKALDDSGGFVESLNKLVEQTGMEKSLLSYHLRSREAKGLESLGLVYVVKGDRGRTEIRLTEMGRLMLISGALEEQGPEHLAGVAVRTPVIRPE